MEGVRPVRPMREEELSSDLPGGEAEAGLQTRNSGRLHRTENTSSILHRAEACGLHTPMPESRIWS